ncbi:MAG TPA: hypothetical protein VMV05_09310 [bacterium]|nr:hypothetical protein [bacterium]
MNHNSRNFPRGLFGWLIALFLVLRPVVVCASNAIIQSRVATALSDDSASAQKAPSIFNRHAPLKKIAKQLPRPKNIPLPAAVVFFSAPAEAPSSFSFHSGPPHPSPLVPLRI